MALSDQQVQEAVVLAKLLLEKLGGAGSIGGAAAGGMVEIAGRDRNNPQGFLVRFGKYRGYGVEDIEFNQDKSYLQWLTGIGIDKNTGLEEVSDYAESNRELRDAARVSLERLDLGTPAPAVVGAVPSAGSESGGGGEDIPF